MSNLLWSLSLQDRFSNTLNRLDNGISGVLRKVDRVNSSFLSLSRSPARDELGRYTKQTKTLGDVLARTGEAAKKLRPVLMGVGLAGAAAMTAFAADTVKTGATFESQMSSVGAITNATTTEFLQLESAAKKAGSTTAFTATDSAKALEFLGMAGFNANQSITALPKTLELAQAGSVSLAESADIGSNALSAYGFRASELGRVNDVLAKTITSSNTNLSQFAEGFKFAAPIARAAGVDFEETAAAIGIMGDAGIQGSLAGTALRSALVRLQKPPKMAQKALSKLGIQPLDPNGELKSLNSILTDLQKSGATNADMFAIFGTEAASGMQVLFDSVTSNEKSLQSYTDTLRNSTGTAADIARKKMDNLSGSWKTFNSRLESVKIELFQAVSPALRLLVDDMTGAISGTGSFIETLRSGVDWFRTNWHSIKDGFMAGGIAAGVLTTGVLALNVAMLANPVFLITGGIAALSAGIGYLYTESETARMIMTGLWDSMTTGFSNIWESGKQTIGGLIDLFTGLTEGVSALVDGDFSKAGTAFLKAGKGIADMVTGSIELINPMSILEGTGDAFGNGMEKGKASFAQSELEGQRAAMGVYADQQARKREQKSLELQDFRSAMEAYGNRKGGGSTDLTNPALPTDFGGGDDTSGAAIMPVSPTMPEVPTQTTGGGGGKNITIRIDKLVENLNITAENVEQSAGRIKEIVTQALMDAVNDAQLAQG